MNKDMECALSIESVMRIRESIVKGEYCEIV